ncbi:TIGR04086 family membrane protein [Selenihalanaerobacter shriftii]|uniref:Putative membrane protein, TIGR04086 family n=1 Tax=Selenihalanaerobacter shriftii TaxID=142842 RepID=A0A1T4JN75_9FIRM|nr:TIGR04086 family membrane protein [Selenihalanaerobacter shriftii]SJZ31475.1 putative membrane protein, TIGR04086 family [Selenihalanaerobacter shriftii]
MAKDRNANETSLKVQSVSRGILISLGLLLSGSILIGLIITFANFDKIVVQRILIIFNYISILVGSFLTGGEVKKKGWLNGSLVGLSHMAVIFIISTFWVENLSAVGVGGMLAIGTVTGFIGGMLGINLQ